MSQKRRISSSVVPQYNPNKKTVFKYLNQTLAELQVKPVNNDEAKVLVSVQYVQDNFECLFDWDKGQMVDFWNFIRDIHKVSWQDLKHQAGDTGFGYTILPSNKYPSSGVRNELSQDINFFELRVNQKARVHGFRVNTTFYMCWLDRNHKICP